MKWSGGLVVVFLGMTLAGCLGDPAPPSGADGAGPESWYEGVVWDTTGQWSRTLSAGVHDVLPPELLSLQSQDGVAIGIAVWRPDTTDPVPVIVEAGPYFQDDMTAEFFDIEYYVERFVPHGFAYARVAVRGTGGSGGCQEFMGPSEQRDLSDAVTALATQPWANGNVGMVGKSYDGSTPWMVAAQGNPHLKTIVPIAGITDPQQAVFPNGTTSSFHFTGMINYWRYMGIQHGSDTPGPEWLTPDRWCPGFLAASPEFAHAMATGEVGAIDPSYWEERDFGSRVLDNYDGSVFMIHGFDDTIVLPDQPFPLVNQLQGAGVPVKMWLGQWDHYYPDVTFDDRSERWDFAETLLRWFQRWLYEDVHVATGPVVDVQDDTFAWRTEETWPPGDAKRVPLYLGDGVLAWEPQPAGSAPTFSPLAIGTTEPVSYRTFTVELDRPLHIAGHPWLDVTIEPLPPTSGLFVRLLKSDGDGGWTDMAQGGGSVKSLAREEVGPGQPVPLRIQLFPTDDRIAAGQSLLLAMYANSLAPPTALNMVHWGGEENALRLPVIERDVGDGTYPGQPV